MYKLENKGFHVNKVGKITKNNKGNFRPKSGNFKPNTRSFAPKGGTVYLGNLPYSVTEKDIKALFAKFGIVKTAKLITQPGSTKSKGIAFIYMLKEKDALKAVEYFNRKSFSGRTLKCSIAKERGEEQKKNTFKPRVRTKTSKEDLAAVKKERRRSSLDKMFESIGK